MFMASISGYNKAVKHTHRKTVRRDLHDNRYEKPRLKRKTSAHHRHLERLGKELAYIHARRGGSLILVARRQDLLEALARELQDTYGTTVYIISKDLSKETAPEEIYAEVQAKGLQVDYLINNAGLGGQALLQNARWKST